jgi:hypothetical protein
LAGVFLFVSLQPETAGKGEKTSRVVNLLEDSVINRKKVNKSANGIHVYGK